MIESQAIDTSPTRAGLPSAEAQRGLLGHYAELAKLRLNTMVVATTAVGFVMASRLGINWTKLWWTLLGTFLVAGGASAFNQCMEMARDAKMIRTRNRPLAGRYISRRHGFVFGLLTSVTGLAILCPLASGATAVLGLVNLLIYVLIYTPLKTRSTLNTLVGAICGAIPPMMGWVAAASDYQGGLEAGAWILAAILFVWQIPHFLALAWMYREQYARGGYKMLPAADPSGDRTALMMQLYALALIPLCLLFSLEGVATWWFAGAAVPLAFVMIIPAMRFTAEKSRESAKTLFLGSILYLPLLMLLMILFRGSSLL